jgi:hypothetical protein
MRSINVKRVAAIATGAAMVGSVLASSALGAVQTSGDVTTLISNIKANLNDVQIAVGTNGAAISDGVQAAKIAAVLASLNYESAAIDPSDVVLTDKKVVVKTTAGAGIDITPSVFSLEFSGSTTDTSSVYGYKTGINNVTLTPLQLSDVLSQDTLSAYITSGGTTAVQKFTYQEQIIINGPRYVQYHEQATPAGHGLYFNAPFGNLQYKLDFLSGGQGLPTNATYAEIPEITVLGTKYAIDTTELAKSTPRLVLYSGAQQEMLEGETIQVGDTTITVTGIGQKDSTSGVIFTAFVSAERGGVTQTHTIQTASGFDFFADSGDPITFYVQSIQYGASGGSRLIARIGSGKVVFTQGLSFPLDDQWTVKEMNWDLTGVGGYKRLNYVLLEYGKLAGADPFERGTFSGTVNDGLAQNTQVPGPKNQDGDPTFYFESVGFGGATPVDYTEVTFRGFGTGTSLTASDSVMQVSWTDRDGLPNAFDPTLRTYANISTAAPAVTNSVILQQTAPALYTIANSKVLYLEAVESPAGDDTWRAVFRVGGPNGVRVETGGGLVPTSGSSPSLTNVADTNFTYTGISGTMLCQVQIIEPTAVNITSKHGAAACDLYPDQIKVGPQTVFDRDTSAVTALNLTGVLGGFKWNTTTSDSAVSRPAAIITDNSGGSSNDIVILYDDSTVAYGADASTYGGMQVYNATDGPSAVNITSGTDLSFIDQAKATTYETDFYHVSQGGVRLDGATSNQIIATIPEAMPNALVKVGSLVTSGGDGTVTVTEGQKVGNVEIIEILASVSGLPTGQYYTMKSTVLPESLVTWDNAVTKNYVIVVGGPYVNNIAAGMSAANMITQVGAQYLVAEGSKLLVAGYLATDTAAAADELVRLLKA